MDRRLCCRVGVFVTRLFSRLGCKEMALFNQQRGKHFGVVQADRIEVGELIVGKGRGPGQSTGSGDWASYTMTIQSAVKAASPSVDSATYSIQGKTLILNYVYVANASAGAGSGVYSYALPPGCTAKMKFAAVHTVGQAEVISGGIPYAGSVALSSATTLTLRVTEGVNPPAAQSNTYLPLNTVGGTQLSFTAIIELA